MGSETCFIFWGGGCQDRNIWWDKVMLLGASNTAIMAIPWLGLLFFSKKKYPVHSWPGIMSLHDCFRRGILHGYVWRIVCVSFFWSKKYAAKLLWGSSPPFLHHPKTQETIPMWLSICLLTVTLQSCSLFLKLVYTASIHTISRWGTFPKNFHLDCHVEDFLQNRYNEKNFFSFVQNDKK